MNTEFSCGGFDVRTWPYAGRPTTDATEWEQSQAYDAAKRLVGGVENDLQLLCPRTGEEFEGLIHLIAATPGATLIAIDFLDTTVFAAGSRFKPCPIPSGNWEILGLDVSDLNGLFSYFSMKDPARSIRALDGDEVGRALLIGEMANIAVPAHRPFVVSRIRRYISE
jgi:hypothetical protein